MKVKHIVSLLKLYPYAGLKSFKRPGYMKFLLTEHNTLYYRLKNNKLIIINIYDNRQNPDKIKF